MRKATSAVLAVLLALTVSAPRPARADLFGGDVAVLSAILAEDLLQGITLANQLTQMTQQVKATMQTLKTLDPRSFTGVQDLLQTTDTAVMQLNSNITGLDMNLGRMQAELQALTAGDTSGVRFRTFEGRYDAWTRLLKSSADLATRSQSDVSNIQRNSQAARQILERSQGADGEVRQLQSIVQMLGVMQNQLNELTLTIKAANSTTATMQANAVAEREKTEAERRALHQGYYNSKPPRSTTRLATPPAARRSSP